MLGRRGAWRLAAVMVTGLICAVVMVATASQAQTDDDATALTAEVFKLRRARKDAEATEVAKQVLAIREKALGGEHSEVIAALDTLATLYREQGRHHDAEAIFRRILTTTEKTQGPDHLDVAHWRGRLAGVYRDQRRYAEAEQLLKYNLAITEKAQGPFQQLEGTMLFDMYVEQGRYADAEALQKYRLAITERTKGPDHPNLAQLLNVLAGLYRQEGRYEDAELAYHRSVAIMAKSSEPLDNFNHVVALNELGWLRYNQSDWAQALSYWRRSAPIIKSDVIGLSRWGGTLRASDGGQSFEGYIKATYRLRVDGLATESVAVETFEIAQWARASQTSAAVTAMASRLVKNSPHLAELVRERQNVLNETSRKYTEAVVDGLLGGPQTSAYSTTRDRLDKLDEKLLKEFPDYEEFARSTPLTVSELQAQLREDEALVLFLDTAEKNPLPQETFVWVVTNSSVRWVRSELGTELLAKRVQALRCGLDQTLWTDYASIDKCTGAAKSSQRTETVNINGKDVLFNALPFSTAVAHELYASLLAPVDDLIKGKHLLVVPSGALTSLPFNVLVTEPPKEATPSSLAAYRDVAWLGTRQAITVLPSVGSLKALRQFARGFGASKVYLGVGNPLLEGSTTDPKDRDRAEEARIKQQCPKSFGQRIAAVATRPLASFAKLFRGKQADIEEVRAWSPLPETADELCEVGRRLGVPESEIVLGARATEATLKDMSEKGMLAQYAIVHFATHGALTGQVQGTAEPGLILTPPAKGTSDAAALERDDGFLTASEIGGLKLNADWVILSACNTAGGQSVGAEALSGMARAFFYAGARALLVSHWEVGSDAAVKLTTRAFAEIKANPKVGRAEAMRISMRELLEKGAIYHAHPTFWGPFVVVGEGGGVRH